MKPGTFLRSLYCVDSSYHELRGSAAAALGCPTTAGGSRAFRGQNPALFSASGFAEHPYEEVTPPNEPLHLCGTKLCTGRSDPDFADLPELPRLARTLDRLNGVYGSHTHFPIWSTEYGFRTTPPDPHEGIDPTTAADYMNWAEYLSYKQPRTYSYSQYALIDEAPPAYFDTGLINPDGSLKPGFDAYRMPLFLPTTTMSSSQQVEVWGGVRPSRYAWLDTGQTQSVQIEFQAGSTGPWQVIDTVAITNPKGYFDVHLAFPKQRSGQAGLDLPGRRRTPERRNRLQPDAEHHGHVAGGAGVPPPAAGGPPPASGGPPAPGPAEPGPPGPPERRRNAIAPKVIAASASTTITMISHVGRNELLELDGAVALPEAVFPSSLNSCCSITS